jgi:hypothetical protein
MREALVRWLFSLAAACYIVAALTFLPAWIRSRNLSPTSEWVTYLVAELIALGVLVMFALWWLIGRPGTENQHFHPSRFLGLTATVLTPLFALLVIPIGCFIFIPGASGTIAGTAVFAISLIALLGASFYARTPRS